MRSRVGLEHALCGRHVHTEHRGLAAVNRRPGISSSIVYGAAYVLAPQSGRRDRFLDSRTANGPGLAQRLEETGARV